jgi:hypothetical protein
MEQEFDNNKYLNLRKVVGTGGGNSSDGMLVIKCKCEDEIRRIPILNRELTYDELCLMMHRLFRSKVSDDPNNIILKYRDDEGDIISLTDDLDISHAANISNVLKIIVYDKVTLPQPTETQGLSTLTSDLSTLSLSHKSLVNLRDKLKDISNNVNALLKAIPTDQQIEEATKKFEKKDQESIPVDKPRPLSTSDMAELLGSKPKVSFSQQESQVDMQKDSTSSTTPSYQQNEKNQMAINVQNATSNTSTSNQTYPNPPSPGTQHHGIAPPHPYHPSSNAAQQNYVHNQGYVNTTNLPNTNHGLHMVNSYLPQQLQHPPTQNIHSTNIHSNANPYPPQFPRYQ